MSVGSRDTECPVLSTAHTSWQVRKGAKQGHHKRVTREGGIISSLSSVSKGEALKSELMLPLLVLLSHKNKPTGRTNEITVIME